MDGAYSSVERTSVYAVSKYDTTGYSAEGSSSKKPRVEFARHGAIDCL